MDDWKVIWAAGFFDGEGTVALSPHGHGRYDVYRHLQVSAAQKVTEPLYILRDTFGGNIYDVFPNHPKRILYRWEIGTQGAVKVLRAMLPYLSVKREKALLGIEWQDTMDNSKYGRWYHLSEETRNKRLEILSKFYGIVIDRVQLIPPPDIQRESPNHCPEGHPYNEANTYYYLGKYRQCRECHKLRQLARYDKLRKVQHSQPSST